MFHASNAGTTVVLAVALLAPAAGAQNIEEMARWTAAGVIHYDVVAEFTGTSPILKSPPNSPVTGYTTQVKDRYQIGFDWNPTAMALVGTATIRNYPATLPAGIPGATMFGNACPAPKVNGAFDYADVVAAKAGPLGSNTLELSTARSYPAGSIAYAAEGPCTNWLEVPKKTETVPMGLMVPPGLYFAMPAAAGNNITVGKDGRTMTLVDKPNGWTYTYTLRIVK